VVELSPLSIYQGTVEFVHAGKVLLRLEQVVLAILLEEVRVTNSNVSVIVIEGNLGL
jgi:hypothetical protein